MKLTLPELRILYRIEDLRWGQLKDLDTFTRCVIKFAYHKGWFTLSEVGPYQVPQWTQEGLRVVRENLRKRGFGPHPATTARQLQSQQEPPPRKTLRVKKNERGEFKVVVE